MFLSVCRELLDGRRDAFLRAHLRRRRHRDYRRFERALAVRRLRRRTDDRDSADRLYNADNIGSRVVARYRSRVAESRDPDVDQGGVTKTSVVATGEIYIEIRCERERVERRIERHRFRRI